MQVPAKRYATGVLAGVVVFGIGRPPKASVPHGVDLGLCFKLDGALLEPPKNYTNSALFLMLFKRGAKYFFPNVGETGPELHLQLVSARLEPVRKRICHHRLGSNTFSGMK